MRSQDEENGKALTLNTKEAAKALVFQKPAKNTAKDMAALFRWPRCRHSFHAECAAHHARANRRTPAGEILPSLPDLRRCLCPLCRQAFGSGSDAQESYDQLVNASRSIDFSAYSRSAEGARTNDNVPSPQRPHAPRGIHPLCHHLCGGPPDFCTLQDRRMHWAPAAQHAPRWHCGFVGGRMELQSVQSKCPHGEGHA